MCWETPTLARHSENPNYVSRTRIDRNCCQSRPAEEEFLVVDLSYGIFVSRFSVYVCVELGMSGRMGGGMFYWGKAKDTAPRPKDNGVSKDVFLSASIRCACSLAALCGQRLSS